MSEVDNRETSAEDAAPGAALAAARTAQNLSIAEVARQLKLSAWQIEALEAGTFDKLPGAVFVRGFIRNYARLLKLDPDRLLPAVADLPAHPARDEIPPSQNIPFPAPEPSRWPGYVAITLLVAAGLVTYDLYWNEPAFVTVKRPAHPAAPAAATAASPAVIPAPATVSVAPAASSPAAAPAVVETAAKTENTPAAPAPDATARQAVAGAGAQPNDAQAAAAPTAPATLPEYDAQPGPGESQVRLVFELQSWVEIRDRDGKTIFSGLNQPGTEQRINGKPPLSLVVGNARGVRLTYNDRPIDLARYTKIDVARLTLE